MGLKKGSPSTNISHMPRVGPREPRPVCICRLSRYVRGTVPYFAKYFAQKYRILLTCTFYPAPWGTYEQSSAGSPQAPLPRRAKSLQTDYMRHPVGKPSLPLSSLKACHAPSPRR